MNGQTIIIIFLGLIVLKLYPDASTALDYAFWIVFPLLVIAFLVVGFFWLAGYTRDCLDNRASRKQKKKELKSIAKNLKEIDRLNDPSRINMDAIIRSLKQK